jgi:CheY-like chemotaxis protein
MGTERVHPTATAAPLNNFEMPDLASIRVLLVDDEPDARELISHILCGCGASATAAANAMEALKLLEEQEFDVLISDIGMPEVDGYELLRRARPVMQKTGRRIPAIALTAFARSEDRTKALQAGFLVHVAKPVEPSELAATVASVTDRTFN